MTARINPNERDSVLFAFHEECARPTAEQIIEWVSRFPEYADDIRAHASVALELDAHAGDQALEPDDSLLALGHSVALNALFDADHPVESIRKDANCSLSFQELLHNAGTNVPLLAHELDVGRGILADLVNGWMSPPICKRLLEVLISRFSITKDQFDIALRMALNNPYLGHARADQPPEVTPRPCKEIILESSMSSERKSYWIKEG